MFVDLQNLINHWNNMSKEDWAIEGDMSNMYEQDAKDAQRVLDYLVNDGYEPMIEAARSALSFLDTSPREDIVMAIYADTNDDFVRELGWEIA